MNDDIDYLRVAADLINQLAQTAVVRDAQGGTPFSERQLLRESGLLRLIIPTCYGGAGASWTTAFQIVREIAKVDSAIAHVYSYHHLGVVVPHIFGSAEQAQHYYTETIQNNWFWANAVNPLDRRVTLTQDGDRFRLNGIKSFCSGSVDSDMLPVTAVQGDHPKLSIALVPTQRQGVTVHHDWDNMGQRQTDSGSVSFDHVEVFSEELIPPATDGAVFRSFRACLTQINLANIYLGIALGAFEAAKDYTHTHTKPWFTAGVTSATQDPFIVQHYGEMWVKLQAAIALTDQAGALVQQAWNQEHQLTATARGECAVAIATAKIMATQIGLEVTTKIFEVMGARATASKYGFDRYWRNLRTFTLHDPVDYKLLTVGHWALNQQLPEPNFYT